jgi:S1-C subfamily serine protease
MQTRAARRQFVRTVVATVFIATTFSIANARQLPSTSAVAKAIAPTAVTIRTANGTGSGVVVANTGTILTSLHVVRGSTAASITMANGDVYDDVQVIDFDVRRDLVVLKIKAFGLIPARFGNSDDVAVGTPVLVLGSPRGLDNTLSDGLVSAIRDTGDGFHLIQTTAPASPGSSGGGLFSSTGELIGIVTSKLTTAENVNFATPINYARGLLSDRPSFSLADLDKRLGPLAPQTSSTSPALTAGASDSDEHSRVGAILVQSGLHIDAVGDNWRVTFKGNNADSVPVTAWLHNDVIVFGSDAVASLPLTNDELTSLLIRSFSEDLVKIGVVDKSVIVSAEAEARTLDGVLAKRLFNDVAVVADDVFGELTRLSSPGARIDIYPPLVIERHLANAASMTLNGDASRLQYSGKEWHKYSADDLQQFRNTSGEAFFRVIAERSEVPLESMEQIAIDNARNVDPGAKITKRGRQLVNGQPSLVLEISATISGIPFVLYGHYFSGPSGTVQIVGWTAQNLFDEYKAMFDAVVAGFTTK